MHAVPVNTSLTGPRKVMEHLEDDFLAGLLDIPDIICEEIPAVPPPTTKATKKRVALADVDTNVVEDGVNHQAKKKKTTTSAMEDTEKQQKKKTTASKKNSRTNIIDP